MSRWIGIPLAVTTAFLNWLVFYKVAAYFHSKDPIFIANILILAIVLHELGHLIILESHGIKTHLIFLVVMGGAISDPKYNVKRKQLSWSTLAAVSLAGVTANVLMVIGSFVLYWTGLLTSGQLSQIANLNGVLILYNLLPLWIFDGGHFAKFLFNSIPEDKDFGYMVRIAATVGIMAIMATILSKYDFTITFCLIFWGLHFQSHHDDPRGSYSQLAMTRKQQCNWASYYVLLISLGIVLMAATKKWMV